jgi:hypothetical protein
MSGVLRAQQQCANCNAFIPGSGGKGLCKAKPPTPVCVGVGQSSIAVPGQLPAAVPVVIAYFPTMSENEWCREWAEDA